MRVKFGGGHAGHNGLKSISAHIGNDYHRARIGIGHPGSREAVVSYVLHDFSKKDKEWLEPLLTAIARAAPHLLAGQDAKFLNEIARVSRPVPESALSPREDKRPAPEPVAAQPAPKPAKAPIPEAAIAAASSAPAAAPIPTPPPATREPETAAAPPRARTSASVPKSKPEAETSLAAKLKAWFSRR